jgi:hypothetical protein
LKKKEFSSAFLTAVVLASLISVSTGYFDTAYASTNISGVITSNTTWTQANSPYALSGNLLVTNGITLTIEAGVIVNLGDYYILVNGTLQALGDSANPIALNGGQISFTQHSIDWNESTAAGCIIKNAVLTSAASNIVPFLSISSAVAITDNKITCYSQIIRVLQGSPTISNNTITLTGPMVDFIANWGGSPVFSNNTIKSSSGRQATGIIGGGGKILGNTIDGFDIGLSGSYLMIEGNLIVNNNVGIKGGAKIIENNTIAENRYGVSDYSGTDYLTYNDIFINNNIFNNTFYNLRTKSNYIPVSNATYNWWGTTDAQTVGQTINDFDDDFTLGTINFIPFLTAPNSIAPAYITAFSGDGGSINPNGFMMAKYGSSQNFSITANTGFHILDVSVNKISVGAVSTYTIQDIQESTTISATFAPNPTSTPSPPPSPTPSPTPNHTPPPTPTPTYTPPPTPTSTAIPTSTPMPTPNPTTTIKSTLISISVDTLSANVGSAVNIKGSLSDLNGNLLQNKLLTLSYTVAGSTSWIPIGSGTTNTAGEYNIQWVNTASGTFALKAEWNGNNDYLSASNTTTISFLPYENQNIFFVESNSTVTALAFNSTSSELSFAVRGVSGTAGYVKVTIAKSIISNAENIIVHLDGNQLTYEVTSNSNTWLLTFTYHHSTHQVKINLASDTAETLSQGVDYWIWAASAIAICLLLIVVTVFWCRNSWFKKNKLAS